MNIMSFFNVLPVEERFHCHRVAAVSKLLAEAMELSSPEIDVIEHSAFFHDIGKAVNPRALSRVPSEMSAEDRAVVMRHTTDGQKILASHESLLSTAPIVALQHHEYLDGSGYLRLTDKAIHPHAKLVTVADVFDKLAFCRPGEEREKVERACAALLQCAETKLDARTVLLLLTNMDRALKVCRTTNTNAFSSENTHC